MIHLCWAPPIAPLDDSGVLTMALVTVTDGPS